MPRWYVFPRQMWQSSCSSCSAVIPFMVPCVPTGMNTGVLTLPCGSESTHARALLTGHSATTRRASGKAEETVLPAAMSYLHSHVPPCIAGAAILEIAQHWNIRIHFYVPPPARWLAEISFPASGLVTPLFAWCFSSRSAFACFLFFFSSFILETLKRKCTKKNIRKGAF